MPTAVLTLTAIPAVVPDSTILSIPSSVVFARNWGTQGTGDGEFDVPAAMAVASCGSVYVAYMKDHRIQEFTSAGVFASTWGRESTGEGEFDGPVGLAGGSDGSVYDSAYSNYCIQKFTPDADT